MKGLMSAKGVSSMIKGISVAIKFVSFDFRKCDKSIGCRKDIYNHPLLMEPLFS